MPSFRTRNLAIPRFSEIRPYTETGVYAIYSKYSVYINVFCYYNKTYCLLYNARIIYTVTYEKWIRIQIVCTCITRVTFPGIPLYIPTVFFFFLVPRFLFYFILHVNSVREIHFNNILYRMHYTRKHSIVYRRVMAKQCRTPSYCITFV